MISQRYWFAFAMIISMGVLSSAQTDPTADTARVTLNCGSLESGTILQPNQVDEFAFPSSGSYAVGLSCIQPPNPDAVALYWG
jgi:hypothetical protein